MKKILLIACIIFAGMSATAQISTLLEKGKSGIGLKGIYESSNGYYGFGGKIDGSILGKVDIEFCYKYTFWDQAKNGLLMDGANSFYYEGRLTWWLIRKEIIPAIDVNFGILAGFDYSSYNNYYYAGESNDSTTSFDNYMDGQIGIIASVNFQVAKSWFLLPKFAIYYEVGKVQESTQTEKLKSDSHGVTSQIGLTLMKRFTKGSGIYLEADSFTETYGSYPFYQFSLGYVLPF